MDDLINKLEKYMAINEPLTDEEIQVIDDHWKVFESVGTAKAVATGVASILVARGTERGLTAVFKKIEKHLDRCIEQCSRVSHGKKTECVELCRDKARLAKEKAKGNMKKD